MIDAVPRYTPREVPTYASECPSPYPRFGVGAASAYQRGATLSEELGTPPPLCLLRSWPCGRVSRCAVTESSDHLWAPYGQWCAIQRFRPSRPALANLTPSNGSAVFKFGAQHCSTTQQIRALQAWVPFDTTGFIRAFFGQADTVRGSLTNVFGLV